MFDKITADLQPVWTKKEVALTKIFARSAQTTEVQERLTFWRMMSLTLQSTSY